MSEEALVLEMRLARREIAEYPIELLGEAVEAEAIFSFDLNSLQAAEIVAAKIWRAAF